MALQEEENIFYKNLTKISKAGEITRDAITDFESVINENSDDELVLKCSETFMRISSEYVTALENLISKFEVNIEWLPPNYSLTNDSKVYSDNGSYEIEFQYSDGCTPWSFYLSYRDTEEFDSMLSDLKNLWKGGNLIQFDSLPNVGTFVICSDRGTIFRGLVLAKFSDKVRVRNIDDTYVKVLKLENLYKMNRKINLHHAQTVQCCLTKDKKYKKMWSSDLCDLFKNTMKECSLQVCFQEELPDTFPPVYLIEMIGHRETTVHFNKWICQKIFPEIYKFKKVEDVRLENLSDNISDPYYEEKKVTFQLDDNKKKNKKHHLEKKIVKHIEEVTPLAASGPVSWSPSLFIPPVMTSHFLSSVPSNIQQVIPAPDGLFNANTISAQYSATAVYSGINNGNISMPQQWSTTSSIILNPTSNSRLNVNTPIFEPRQKKLLPISGKEQSSSKPINIKPIINSTAAVDDSEICEVYSKNRFCVNIACNKKHIHLDQATPTQNKITVTNLKPNQGKTAKSVTNEIHLKDSLSDIGKKESLNDIVGKVIIQNIVNILSDGKENSCDEANVEDNEFSHDDDDDEDLEEPCINDGYIPTDESRLCKFYSKTGHCWKRQCNKEHTMPISYKWTSDSQETYQNAFNLLNLPDVGETIELLVTKIENPFTFFARLPDVYSDLGEGINNIETLSTLHKALNDPKNIKSYISPSGILEGDSELYLAKALDNFWKRALVLNPDENEKYVEVYYVDSGDKEKIPRFSLKKIEGRFLHLPCQAVRCTLYNLYCGSDMELRKNGSRHLESVIKGKIITGKVVERNVIQTSLDLIVNYGEQNINNIMITRGFCEETRTTS